MIRHQEGDEAAPGGLPFALLCLIGVAFPSVLSSVAPHSHLIPCGKAMRRTVPGFFLSQAQPHLSTDLGFEEQFIEERIGCSVLLACVLISCSSSFDFYSQAY